MSQPDEEGNLPDDDSTWDVHFYLTAALARGPEAFYDAVYYVLQQYAGKYDVRYYFNQRPMNSHHWQEYYGDNHDSTFDPVKHQRQIKLRALNAAKEIIPRPRRHLKQCLAVSYNYAYDDDDEIVDPQQEDYMYLRINNCSYAMCNPDGDNSYRYGVQRLMKPSVDDAILFADLLDAMQKNKIRFATTLGSPYPDPKENTVIGYHGTDDSATKEFITAIDACWHKPPPPTTAIFSDRALGVAGQPLALRQKHPPRV